MIVFPLFQTSRYIFQIIYHHTTQRTRSSWASYSAEIIMSLGITDRNNIFSVIYRKIPQKVDFFPQRQRVSCPPLLKSSSPLMSGRFGINNPTKMEALLSHKQLGDKCL